MLICLLVNAPIVRAECNPGICSGNPCTITGTHDIDEECVLDFSGKTVTIGKNVILRSAESEYGEFTILAHNLTHKGLLKGVEGFITIELTGDFATVDVAGGGDNAGRIDASGSDGGGYVDVVAEGKVDIASQITARGGYGDIWIEGCHVTLAGTLDAAGGDGDGSIYITYHATFTAISGEMDSGTSADASIELICSDDGLGFCVQNPVGLNCDSVAQVCTSGDVEVNPPAGLLPEILVSCTECSNGVLEPGEACDDGNLNECDGCSPSCQPQGDGGACTDDGNPCTDEFCDPGSGCLHPPNSAPCNDGNVCTTGDQCSGGMCSGAPDPGATACVAAWLPGVLSVLDEEHDCGNGILEPGEACDDGNPIDGDGCDGSCQVEKCFTCAGAPSVCGCDVGATCGTVCLDTLFCTDTGGSCECMP